MNDKIRSGSEHKNEIIGKISEVTGLAIQTVRTYVSTDYKQEPTHIESFHRKAASDVLISKFGERDKDYGEHLVERFRKEILRDSS